MRVVPARGGAPSRRIVAFGMGRRAELPAAEFRGVYEPRTSIGVPRADNTRGTMAGGRRNIHERIESLVSGANRGMGLRRFEM